ncbi:MAG: hypothetical protein JSW27_17715 [Phycisphaerales bacterium]|nr:MAG: hypothetical protein JSW27_17715 [Phycisphaerales bacterium]
MLAKGRHRVIPIVLAFVASAAAMSQGERGIVERIGGREFPSVFQAWSRVENLPDANTIEGIARHDLAWNAISLCGLRWDTAPRGLAKEFEPDSIETALKRRRKLLALNPNLILIAEIRYRDAHGSFLPENHMWWMRDEQGQIVKGWAEGGFLRLDYRNPAFRRHVAQRALAVIESGVADGILLDWWHEDDDRLALVQEIRGAIGDDPLVIANTNDRTAPRTGAYINGFFMECYRSETAEDWQRIAETLSWAEQHLRQPRVNCVEVWYHNSRRDLNLMRAVTALTLTHSNGYCLFSDPNPLPSPDHLHDWYPFWDTSLGRPVGQAIHRDDGATQRQFEQGTIVYNPMGNDPVEITFDEMRTSRATGQRSRTHTLPACDGDIYLKATSP